MKKLKKARLSEYEKFFIILNYESKSLGRLSELTGINRDTIYKFYKRWQTSKTIINKKGTGRRPILSEFEKKRIYFFLRSNPLKSMREVIRLLNLNCSIMTLQRCLKKLGFYNVRYRQKPMISDVNIEKRLAFANKYKSWTLRQWKKVLFSDKSSIEIGKTYPRKIWIKKEDRGKSWTFLKKKQTFGKRYLKVWSCFSYEGVGELQFIEGGTWDRYKYKQILSDNLLNEAHRLIGNEFIFQEDNDRVHGSKILRTWKRRNKISLLDWPAQSSGLAPVKIYLLRF